MVGRWRSRGSGWEIWDYYDYSGRRVKKEYIYWRYEKCATGGGSKVDDPPAPEYCWYRYGSVWYYYYSGSEVSAVVEMKLDCSNFNSWKYFVYGAGKQIAFKETYSSPYAKTFLVTDRQGNVRNTFYYDASNNPQLGAAYWYDPFGKQVRVWVAGTNQALFTYNFKELDDEASFNDYYYGARFYDPAVGRFLSPDPVKGYTNPYSYVANNPIAFTDPTGMAIGTGGGGHYTWGWEIGNGFFGGMSEDAFSALATGKERVDERTAQRMRDAGMLDEPFPSGGNLSQIGKPLNEPEQETVGPDGTFPDQQVDPDFYFKNSEGEPDEYAAVSDRWEKAMSLDHELGVYAMAGGAMFCGVIQTYGGAIATSSGVLLFPETGGASSFLIVAGVAVTAAGTYMAVEGTNIWIRQTNHLFGTNMPSPSNYWPTYFPRWP